ncbi:hypothetical protein HMI55_001583 [Coelomomyces lativittatus]|nr:hypothetical protein HMI56_002633 [Coelomomyces lativittatus]KAJ1505463.1 hypothetical protein HMI55_001583 [Coelomomyces lativittatus]
MATINAGFRALLSNHLSSKLLTTRPFKKGELITSLEGYYHIKSPTYTSVQVEDNQYIEVNSSLRFMNHSCSPTCYVDTQLFQVVASQDLQAGQEITFFYPSTEWSMTSPFRCWCGHDQCIGLVRGAKYLDYEVLMSFGPINKHILELKHIQLQDLLSKLTRELSSFNSPSNLIMQSASNLISSSTTSSSTAQA